MAKAICAQQGGDPTAGVMYDPEGVRLVAYEWGKYEKAAIVALRAMRDPTDEQLRLFLAEEDAEEDAARRDEIIAVWQWMIDAALAEEG